MKIYDKAAWQIDGGVKEKDVIEHFKFMYGWLESKGFLSANGKEIMGVGIDAECSLTDRNVTAEGKKFLDKYYDEYVKRIDYGKKEDKALLNKLWSGHSLD